MSKVTCTKVRDIGRPGQALYKLSEAVPYGWEYGDTDNDTRNCTNFVIISGVYTTDHGNETYIFAANESGDVLDWCEMPGSYIDDIDHNKAIADAGWELV